MRFHLKDSIISESCCILWKSSLSCLLSLNSFGKHESVAMFSPEDFELPCLDWVKCLNRDKRRLSEVTGLTSLLFCYLIVFNKKFCTSLIHNLSFISNSLRSLIFFYLN